MKVGDWTFVSHTHTHIYETAANTVELYLGLEIKTNTDDWYQILHLNGLYSRLSKVCISDHLCASCTSAWHFNDEINQTQSQNAAPALTRVIQSYTTQTADGNQDQQAEKVVQTKYLFSFEMYQRLLLFVYFWPVSSWRNAWHTFSSLVVILNICHHETIDLNARHSHIFFFCPRLKMFLSFSLNECHKMFYMKQTFSSIYIIMGALILPNSGMGSVPVTHTLAQYTFLICSFLHIYQAEFFSNWFVKFK